MVVKKVDDQDKEGFLRSFTYCIEEALDATNDFSSHQEIFPKDIFTEEELENLPVLSAEKENPLSPTTETSPKPMIDSLYESNKNQDK